MPRLLVITVGGSPEPVKISIDHHRPDYVVYCVSKESRKMVKQEIEPALSHCPEDSEVVYTPDAQNLVETFKALLTEVP